MKTLYILLVKNTLTHRCVKPSYSVNSRHQVLNRFEKQLQFLCSVSQWPSVKLVVTIWIKDGVFKSPGRRLHGETSCKLFGTLHEPVCQSKWKAAGCRSTCLVKISVYFGLFTRHPHFTELSVKPLGKVRAPICTCSMLSCSLHITAEAKCSVFRKIFTSWGEIVLLVAGYAQRLLASGKTCCPH